MFLFPSRRASSLEGRSTSNWVETRSSSSPPATRSSRNPHETRPKPAVLEARTASREFAWFLTAGFRTTSCVPGPRGSVELFNWKMGGPMRYSRRFVKIVPDFAPPRFAAARGQFRKKQSVRTWKWSTMTWNGETFGDVHQRLRQCYNQDLRMQEEVGRLSNLWPLPTSSTTLPASAPQARQRSSPASASNLLSAQCSDVAEGPYCSCSYT